MLIQLRPFAILPGTLADHVSEAKTRATMAHTATESDRRRKGWATRKARHRARQEARTADAVAGMANARLDRQEEAK